MFYLYKGSLCNDLKKINKTINNILEYISLIVDDKSSLFNIRLVLSELLINAYEHGNNCDENKHISLVFKIDNRLINIEVVDEGGGIISPCEYDVRDLKDCGRGLLIVKSLADEVVIEKNKIKCSLSR